MDRRRFAMALASLSLRAAGVQAQEVSACPVFPGDEFCGEGQVYADQIGICVSRTGICEGQEWYCKGHKHPQFHCDIREDGTEEAQCCRKNNHWIAPNPTEGDGRGRCHRWHPKACAA